MVNSRRIRSDSRRGGGGGGGGLLGGLLSEEGPSEAFPDLPTDPPKYPGRLCYCNYSFCPNDTCTAKPDAACYHAIKYNRNENGEWDKSIGQHELGCFPPEAGGSAFQCHGHLTKHQRPTTVKCCFEGDYCNQDLEVPDAVYDPNDIIPPETSWGGSVLLVGGVVVGMLVLLIVAFFLCYVLWKRRKLRKWASDSEFNFDDSDTIEARPKKDNTPWLKALIPLLRPKEKNDEFDFDVPGMLDNWNAVKEFSEMSSGSGSGLPHLVQRTVGRQLTQGDLIGQGRYGTVRKALWRSDTVAVKTFLTTEEASWKNEAEIYNTPMLRHENILGFIASDIRGGSRTEMLLIMDYCDHGSLYDYLKQETLTLGEAISLAYTAIAGIAHLHDEIVGTQVVGTRGKPAIAHRDIKSKNILVKRPGVCAIADFGLALKYSSDDKDLKIPRNRRVGTIRYMAPEVLDNTIKSHVFTAYKQVDMYAFGLVLWEITRRIEEEEEVAVGFSNLPLSSQSSFPTSSSISDSADPSTSETRTNPSFGHSDSITASPPHPPPPMPNYRQPPPIRVCNRPDVLSDDSGVSNGTESSGVSLLSRPMFPSKTAKEYLCPFGDVAPCDPSFERMREIVCLERTRPPIELHWLQQASGTITLARLMRECWSATPEARLTGLNVKKQLWKEVAKFRGITPDQFEVCKNI